MAKLKTEVQTVEAIVVLDRSGSMGVIRDATVEGLGKYVADLKADEADGDVLLSVLQFDHEHEWIIDGKNVQKIRTLPAYEPRGSTALNDAIGRAIARGDKAEADGNKVLLVIVTDGQENASLDYTGPDGQERLKALIEERQDSHGWVVTYLSADLSTPAWEQSAVYGVARGATVAYASNAGSTASSFSSIGNVTKTAKRTSMSSADTVAASNISLDATSSTSDDAARISAMVWDVDQGKFVDPEEAK